MVITKICIAAQPDNLKTDISELETFIFRVNNCYVSRGHYFTPILSENTSGDATRDSEIADCALAFFLTVSGAELPETYKSALNSYNKTGRPRIFTYMKIQGSGDGDLRQGSGNGQLIIDNGQLTNNSTLHRAPERRVSHSILNSPFSTLHSQLISRPYAHIDTLKLEILMQIKQLGLDGVDIHLEDGKAWQGNTVLLSLENVEAVSGYGNLQNLKQKRAELESRYYAAKTRHIENPDDADAYEAFFEASKQRSEAIQQIRDIEAQLYHMMEGMYESSSTGKLSKRQVESYRLIERGRFQDAKLVLDFDEIVKDGRHETEVVENSAMNAQVLVNELLQLKDVNATLLDWDAVDACYKEAVRIEEEHDLPRRAAISLDPMETDYMMFLVTRYRFNEAADLGEKLRKHYQNTENCNQLQNMSYVLNLLGIIYDSTQRMAESEEALKAALAIRRARTEGDPDEITKDIAIVYNNLGNLYYLSGRYEEAIRAHRSAMEIREKLVESNSDAFIEYLAYTYVNLGESYIKVERYSESVELMALARDIFKNLAEKKPDPHLEYLADCNKNLGIAYAQLQRFEEAEQQFIAALEIEMLQAESNPYVYEPRVAECYIEFGNLYLRAKRYAEAKEKYDAALTYYKRLSGRTPDAFEPELAKCYYFIGELYNETKRYSEASEALTTAIRLYEKYRETNPVFAERIADARKILDGVIASQRRQEGAFEQFTKEEKEVALLLTEGKSRTEIINKLRLSAFELSSIIRCIREKISMQGDSSPVIDAVAEEYKLTKREADMLSYLSRNAGNELIASELFLSEETVRIHVRNVIKKLSIENRKSVSVWLDKYSKSM